MFNQHSLEIVRKALLITGTDTIVAMQLLIMLPWKYSLLLSVKQEVDLPQQGLCFQVFLKHSF